MSRSFISGFGVASSGRVKRILCEVGRVGCALWLWLRQVSGDAAYENYLRLARRRGSEGSARVLSREEFYLDALRRRYTGVSRCC
jgi:uncharacterized short protein YbdD (DUF466 family)